MTLTPAQIERLLDGYKRDYVEDGSVPNAVLLLYLLSDSIENFNELNARMSKALGDCIQNSNRAYILAEYHEKCCRVLHAVGLSDAVSELPEVTMTWEEIDQLENE